MTSCRLQSNYSGSKTAKIIKKQCSNIDIQATLVWLTLPFYDFGGFRSVAVNSVYKLQFFTFIFAVLLPVLSRLLIKSMNTIHFRFFKMAALRHLGFLKVRNFNYWSVSEGQYASSCQMLYRSVNPLPRYRNFNYLGCRLPLSWISLSFTFVIDQTKRSQGPNCVTLPNFVEIAEIAAEIWRFFDFAKNKWRPPPCGIFEITNF